jgi:myosin heavy subunit
MVEALEASGYDANLVLSKEHRFERQLASREQELESEKQARLEAQAQVNQNYTQLRAAQEEIKEQQGQLQEQEAEIEQNQAEIAQLRQQIAELQRQSSGQEVADTSGETDGSQEDSLATEIAVPTAIAVVSDDEEIPHLKQITPDPETGEPLVTSNDMAEAIKANDCAPSPGLEHQSASNDTEIARPRPPIAEVEQEANRLNAASAILPASTPARRQKKRKRKGGIFQAEMARLGIRC